MIKSFLLFVFIIELYEETIKELNYQFYLTCFFKKFLFLLFFIFIVFFLMEIVHEIILLVIHMLIWDLIIFHFYLCE